MQRTELVRILRANGWIVVKGNPHGKTYHPDNPKFKIPVPHGSQISDRTAQRILDLARLKK